MGNIYFVISQYSLYCYNVFPFTLFTLNVLPLNRGVVACIKNEPPQDPPFHKEHVCMKFFEDVNRTPCKN